MESKPTTSDVLNEQMKLCSLTFDELAKIHERCAQIAEWQEKHAKLLTELAGLIGVNVTDVEEEVEHKIDSRIITI